MERRINRELWEWGGQAADTTASRSKFASTLGRHSLPFTQYYAILSLCNPGWPEMAKSLQLLLIFFCSLVLDLSVPQCNGLSIYSTSSATSSLVSTRSPSLLYTNSTIHVDEIFTASKYDIVAQVWEVKTHFCTQYRMTGLHRTFHFKCNGVLFTAREVQKWAKTSHRSSWTSLHHCTGERLHWGVN